MVRWMSGLVNGLQNRVHPFESGTHLQTKKTQLFKLSLFCFVYYYVEMEGPKRKNGQVQDPTIAT